MRDELAAELEARFGPLEPLGGGITNHNFRAGDVVVRVAGAGTGDLGIDREVESVATRAAAEIGIAPEVVDVVDGCLVTRFVAGEPLTEPMVRDRIAAVAPMLRAFHDSGTRLAARFDVPAIAREYAARAGAQERLEVRRAIAVADEVAAAVPAEIVPCHNDLLAANLICGDDGRLWLVDWEYAGMGERFFDLANLSINNGFTEDDDRALLTAYGAAPDTFARLRLMRAMSDVRESLWGVVQGIVSELDFDFAAYAATHFERLEAQTSDPRWESWIHDATTP